MLPYAVLQLTGEHTGGLHTTHLGWGGPLGEPGFGALDQDEDPRTTVRTGQDRTGQDRTGQNRTGHVT